jgi:TolA-binding protein
MLRTFLLIAAAGLSMSLAPAFAQTYAAPTAQDTLSRADTRADHIADLEEQLRAATADNERLQYELLQVQRENRRLQGLLAGAAADGVAPSAPAAQAAPPQPAPSATPGPAPSSGPSSLNSAQQRVVGDLTTQPPTTPAPAPAAGPPNPANAQEAYSRARVFLSSGHTAEAEAAFRDFLRDYANAPQAAAQVEDARFLLPYASLARGDNQAAAQGFLEYLQRYRNGARVPEAYARLGMALNGLSRRDDACTAYRQALGHPRANAAVRQLAQREASALRCT